MRITFFISAMFLLTACPDPWRKQTVACNPLVVQDTYDDSHTGNGAGSFSVPSGRNVVVVVSSPMPGDGHNPYDHRIELAQNDVNNQGATTGAQIGDMLVISNRCCRQILAGDAGRWTYEVQMNTSVQLYFDGVGWWPSYGEGGGPLVGVAKTAAK